MVSSTKILKLSICMIISTLGVLVEAGQMSNALEPLLAAGVITLLLNKKGGGGYSGRAQSYENAQPLQHTPVQQHRQPLHHHHTPVQQAYEPAGQGNGGHEHEQPNHGSPRFEMQDFPYDSSSPSMYTMPGFASKQPSYGY